MPFRKAKTPIHDSDSCFPIEIENELRGNNTNATSGGKFNPKGLNSSQLNYPSFRGIELGVHLQPTIAHTVTQV